MNKISILQEVYFEEIEIGLGISPEKVEKFSIVALSADSSKLEKIKEDLISCRNQKYNRERKEEIRNFYPDFHYTRKSIFVIKEYFLV